MDDDRIIVYFDDRSPKPYLKPRSDIMHFPTATRKKSSRFNRLCNNCNNWYSRGYFRAHLLTQYHKRRYDERFIPLGQICLND